MKPGDMIEWAYAHNQIVFSDEVLYSSTMSHWVPIGAPALLISITEETYVWFSSKGLFHARVGDMLTTGWKASPRLVQS